ncbi:MAG: hypothetical protein OHK0013_40240 [Sandaracinaceae bacterium]
MQPRKEDGRSKKTTKATPRPGARTRPKAGSTAARVKTVKAPRKSTSTASPPKAVAKNGSDGHGARKKNEKVAKVEAKEPKSTVKAEPKPASSTRRVEESSAPKPSTGTSSGTTAASTSSGAAPAPKTNASFARPSPWSAPTLPPVKVDAAPPSAKADGEGEFRVGETVVYPARGVADIVAVEDKDIGGRRQSFYVLRVHDTEQKILVPVNNAAQIGLRRPISEAQVREIFRILKVTDVPLDTQTWNRRYRGFVEKLATGSVFAVAEVLRDLSRVKIIKDGLSFSERQMLERARGLIVKEIAVARAKPEDAVRQQIEAIFA